MEQPRPRQQALVVGRCYKYFRMVPPRAGSSNSLVREVGGNNTVLGDYLGFIRNRANGHAVATHTFRNNETGRVQHFTDDRSEDVIMNHLVPCEPVGRGVKRRRSTNRNRGGGAAAGSRRRTPPRSSRSPFIPAASRSFFAPAPAAAPVLAPPAVRSRSRSGSRSRSPPADARRSRSRSPNPRRRPRPFQSLHRRPRQLRRRRS